MKDSAYKISLDINEHGSQVVLKAKQSDTGRKVHISLRAGGTPYTIAENCYAVFTATKPDGSILYNACTIEGNEIVYEFTEQTCSAIGRSRCEIKLYGLDDKLITSPRFALLIDGTLYPDGSVESTDEFSALTDLISTTLKNIKDATEATQEANEATVYTKVATQNANEATRNADNATENAIAATEAANQATLSAESASGIANQAAEAATQAADLANTRAAGALIATTNSESATENANQATSAATQATQNANTATENANGAAQSANTAANSANTAARSANTATENANGATNRANEATQAANSAASDANLAAENANETLSNVSRIVKNTMAAGKVSGERVTMNDAVAFDFIGCRIFGKTTQDGTPTPYAPVDLVSVGESGSITVNVAGENDAQNMTIATPNGLPGIHVSSGGNYTDANGQQWICDEIDFARGVRITRIAIETVMVARTFAETPDWAGRFVCGSFISSNCKAGTAVAISNFAKWKTWGTTGIPGEECFAISGKNLYYTPPTSMTADEVGTMFAEMIASDTPPVIVAQLETPIETPLSEEELAAYASLHTYRDRTTVSNDAGAWMELEYVMDAKKYIDSQVAGIHTATVE